MGWGRFEMGMGLLKDIHDTGRFMICGFDIMYMKETDIVLYNRVITSPFISSSHSPGQEGS